MRPGSISLLNLGAVIAQASAIANAGAPWRHRPAAAVVIGDEPDAYADRVYGIPRRQPCTLCHGHKTVTLSPAGNTPCPNCKN
jgi:hypothetical protein